MLIIEIHVDSVEEAASDRASQPGTVAEKLQKWLFHFFNRRLRIKNRGDSDHKVSSHTNKY